MSYEPVVGDEVFFTKSPNNSDVAYTVEEVHGTQGVIVSCTPSGIRYDYALSKAELDFLEPVKVAHDDV